MPAASCDTSLLSKAVPEEGMTSSGTISTNVARLSEMGTFTEATRIEDGFCSVWISRSDVLSDT